MPTLTPSQHKAIEALLIASDVKDAAKRAGVAYSTLRGWLAADAAFAAAYADARRQATEQALAVIQASARDAAGVLAEIMNDPDVPPAHRLNAAWRVLELATRAIERDEIERRLADLERQLATAVE